MTMGKSDEPIPPLIGAWQDDLISDHPLIRATGRMVWNYIPDAKLYRITAWRFSTYFVILDIM